MKKNETFKIAIRGHHVRDLSDLMKIRYDFMEDYTYVVINVDSLEFFEHIMKEVQNALEKAYPENL